MRYFTFRFLHSDEHLIHDVKIAGTHEDDARQAAWHCLAAEWEGGSVTLARAVWRIISVVIAPVTDLADALSA